jgi:hypothetical protein
MFSNTDAIGRRMQKVPRGAVLAPSGARPHLILLLSPQSAAATPEHRLQIPRSLTSSPLPAEARADRDASDVSTYPGVVIECRTLGVLRLEQNGKLKKRERNDRLIVVPIKLPRFDSFKTPDDLPERWRSELEEFFVNVIPFENKAPKLLGWAGPEEGDRMVRDCVKGSKAC